MGVIVEKHHHEVAAAQHELGIKFDTLVRNADKMQIYKYVVHQVANAYGKTATFMPKPIFGDNGSGMHVHQSIWKGGKPTFAGDEYAGLSETCLYLYRRHHQACQGNQRLHQSVDQFLQASRSGLRSTGAPCLFGPQPLGLLPHSVSAPTRRLSASRSASPIRPANPYLAFAAMLMAGLDGIKNKIHPGKAMDKDLYDLPPKELKKIPTVCGSLREALESLDKDRKFLTAGGVFDDDQIDAYHRAEDGRGDALTR